MLERLGDPDRPDDLIVECDGCKNLLYIKGDTMEQVAPCPLCGCLNQTQLTPDVELKGRLVLKSPLMNMSKNSVEEGRVSLPDIPEKVQEALLWLQENRWTFGFTVANDDTPPEEDSSSGPEQEPPPK